jgi:hypothetical protein
MAITLRIARTGGAAVIHIVKGGRAVRLEAVILQGCRRGQRGGRQALDRSLGHWRGIARRKEGVAGRVLGLGQKTVQGAGSRGSRRCRSGGCGGCHRGGSHFRRHGRGARRGGRCRGLGDALAHGRGNNRNQASGEACQHARRQAAAKDARANGPVWGCAHGSDGEGVF